MIIFSRNTLREALTGLRVLKLNTQPLPFLQHVLVIGFENRVQFDGTNLDQYLRYEGEAQTTAATRLLVPFDVLDTASKTAEANTEIRITGGEEPRISYGMGSATLDMPFKTINVSEFPKKLVAEGEPIALPAGILGAMNEALGCASTDETRYILNSVYLNAHEVVATDGRQLYRSNSLDLPITEGMIFPSSQVPGILPDEAAQLWRWHHKEHPYAQITVGHWSWITKLVEGNFPNYQQVIPKADSYGGLIRLSEADVERMKTVIPKMPGFKEKDSPVILRVSDKGAELRTLSRLPKVHLSLERSEVVRTVTTDVAFNSRLLLGALQRGMRELHARDSVSPLMMKSWYKADLRATFPRRVVAKAICKKRSQEDAVLAVIDQFAIWAGQQYEGKPISAAVGFDPTGPTGPVTFNHLCSENFSAVLSNGHDTMLVCNFSGEVSVMAAGMSGTSLSADSVFVPATRITPRD